MVPNKPREEKEKEYLEITLRQLREQKLNPLAEHLLCVLTHQLENYNVSTRRREQ
jgi:hypothetical protein